MADDFRQSGARVPGPPPGFPPPPPRSAAPSGDAGRLVRVAALGVVAVAVAGGTLSIVALTSARTAPAQSVADPPPAPLADLGSPAEREVTDTQPEPAPTPLSAQEVAAEFGDAVWRVDVEGCGITASGTAFGVDHRTLVTNWHVTSVDATPQLTSRDGRTSLPGRVIGWSSDPDVAVIAVDEDLPTVLEWAPATSLGEGQELVTLGYPRPAGEFTVAPTTIMSFQTLGGQRQAIRADGALDHGNSGGPALTTNGRVAGVATELLDTGVRRVPFIYTFDHLERAIERILADPSGVEVDCAAAGLLPELPDEWEPWEPESSAGPFTYGDDPDLDELWDACDAEVWAACDDLYWQSPVYSDYETFGGTCGSRASWWGNCEAFMASAEALAPVEEPDAYGTNDDLDTLWDACAAEDWIACDNLYLQAPLGSRYEDFGGSCGDRLVRVDGYCEYEVLVDPHEYGDDPALDGMWDGCAAEDWSACDDLYLQAPVGSRYEEFGSTCGDREPQQYGVCALVRG